MSKRLLSFRHDQRNEPARGAGLGVGGKDAVTAGDGETSLGVAATSRVDPVVPDLQSGIDGVEVVGRLRGWTEVPVVVLSDHEAHDDRARGLDAGAGDSIAPRWIGTEPGLGHRRTVERDRYREVDPRTG